MRNPIEMEERVPGRTGALKVLGGIVVTLVATLAVLAVFGVLGFAEFVQLTLKLIVVSAIVAGAGLAIAALGRRGD